MKAESVIGCVSCGKPALLVGDEVPRQLPACFWCLVERRPGAAALMLKEYRASERARVLAELKPAIDLLEGIAAHFDEMGSDVCDIEETETEEAVAAIRRVLEASES